MFYKNSCNFFHVQLKLFNTLLFITPTARKLFLHHNFCDRKDTVQQLMYQHLQIGTTTKSNSINHCFSDINHNSTFLQKWHFHEFWFMYFLQWHFHNLIINWRFIYYLSITSNDSNTTTAITHSYNSFSSSSSCLPLKTQLLKRGYTYIQ